MCTYELLQYTNTYSCIIIEYSGVEGGRGGGGGGGEGGGGGAIQGVYELSREMGDVEYLGVKGGRGGVIDILDRRCL